MRLNERLRLILRLSVFAFLACVFTSCKTKSNNSDELSVSILPLKYIVDAITCGDFNINVIVPAGASPETYSPTAAQVARVERSQLIFVSSGDLSAESEIVNKMTDKKRIVDLSNGVNLIRGHKCGHSTDAHASHESSADPHIWLAPNELKIMATNAFNAINTLYPDSIKYMDAYIELIDNINATDDMIRKRLDSSEQHAFIVYHPSLAYYAREYGLTQIAIENDGKEPSLANMKECIEQALSTGCKVMLYQKEFSHKVVRTFSKQTGIKAMEFDPTSENILENLLYITDLVIK